jgi:tetratricopeptide (TPR) repeat protein
MATTLMRMMPGSTSNPLDMNNNIVSYLSNFFHLMCPYPDTQFLQLAPSGVKLSQDRTIYDYFISYRHKISADYAQKVRDELVSLGYKVYFAGEVPELSLMDDEQLKNALQQELHRSSILIVMGSEEALGGEWVKWEMDTFSTDHWGRKIPLITNDLPAFNESLRNIHRKDPSALFMYEEDKGAWEENRPSSTTILCLILAREFFRVELQFWNGCSKIPTERREQSFFSAIYYDIICSAIMRLLFTNDCKTPVEKLKAGYLRDLRNYKKSSWRGIIDRLIAHVLILPIMAIYFFINRLLAKLKKVLLKETKKNSGNPGTMFVFNPVTGLSKEWAIRDLFPSRSTNVKTNLGLSQEEKNQLNQLKEQYKKAVAIEEAKSETINTELPKLYSALASLFEKSADYAQANEYYQKALIINGAMANKYSDNGDYSEAIIYLQNSLAIKEKVLLADDPLLGVAYDNIAKLSTAAGDRMQALTYHFKGLKINEAVLAPTDPDLGKAYYNIAITYSYIPDIEQCYVYMAKATDIWEKTLPATDPELVRAQEYLLKLDVVLNRD